MEDAFIRRFLEIRIDERYQLCERLGEGTFGTVFLGRDVDKGFEVAIKLEHHDIAPSLLVQEYNIYQTLQTRPGIPKVFWYGDHVDYRVMVFELLGPNLEDLLRFCGGQFSMKTTLMLLDQLLRRIECLHTIGHRHCDIKPENFLLGTGKQGNVVYMTDLGLADDRPTRDNDTGDASESQDAPRLSLIGTCRYASVNGHLDVAPSCRDDLESLGYVALYFLRGSLPWQGISAANRKEKYRLVLEQKQRTGAEQICEGLPAEFATYMDYLHHLSEPNRPDYRYLRSLFSRLFRRMGFERDNVFDWVIREFDRLSNGEG